MACIQRLIFIDTTLLKDRSLVYKKPWAAEAGWIIGNSGFEKNL